MGRFQKVAEDAYSGEDVWLVVAKEQQTARMFAMWLQTDNRSRFERIEDTRDRWDWAQRVLWPGFRRRLAGEGVTFPPQ